MFIKAAKWLDAQYELTQINLRWAEIMVDANKYQWKPEFLWTKQELDEVIELYEKAYELVNREFEIYMIVKAYDHIPVLTDTFEKLDDELWKLKRRTALMTA